MPTDVQAGRREQSCIPGVQESPASLSIATEMLLQQLRLILAKSASNGGGAGSNGGGAGGMVASSAHWTFTVSFFFIYVAALSHPPTPTGVVILNTLQIKA